MNSIRNIILIGRTGNGKSTLGNVLINRNGRFEEVFSEGEFGVSQTHETKTEDFWENGIRYRIIDTVGIGDTEMTEQQVLYKIAEAAYKVRDGLNQVLFVTRGRFTKEEIFTYNLLREIIFDADIVNYTTIVRTNFSNFRNSSKCETDRAKMIGENPELSEVIRSCRKVVHVDNSPMNIDDELELSVNERKREESRSKMLVHLTTNCYFNYKPRNLDDLNSRIANHMTEIDKLQKQLREASNLNEQQRRRMQNDIDELRSKVSHSTRGFFQKTVGKVGEGVGWVADKAVQVVTYPVRKCDIM